MGYIEEEEEQEKRVLVAKIPRRGKQVISRTRRTQNKKTSEGLNMISYIDKPI